MPSQGQKTPSAQKAAVHAQGIVTRMGRNPQGFGGEAIEPGPAGMRPKRLVLVTAVRHSTYEFLRFEWLAMDAATRPTFDAFVGIFLSASVDSLKASRVGVAARRDAAGAQARGDADPHGNTGSTV